MDKNKTERVRVRDMFSGADKEKIIDAYLMIFEGCQGSGDHAPIRDRLRHFLFLKKAVAYNTDLIAEQKESPEEAQTVFITEYEAVEWDRRGETEFSCVYVKDDEVVEELENTGRYSLVSGYDMEVMSLEEIADMYIARPSIEQYGEEACCAFILRELFYFGLMPDTREQNRMSFFEMIDASLKEVEGREATELSDDDIWSLCLKNCNSQDEKDYMAAEQKFRESVQDIEDRHARRVTERNRKRFIDMLREEYRQ